MFIYLRDSKLETQTADLLNCFIFMIVCDMHDYLLLNILIKNYYFFVSRVSDILYR